MIRRRWTRTFARDTTMLTGLVRLSGMVAAPAVFGILLNEIIIRYHGAGASSLDILVDYLREAIQRLN